MLQQHLGSRALCANPRASEGWFLQLIRLPVVLIGLLRGTPPNNRMRLTDYSGLRPPALG
jgi:hypothetical protein